MKRKLDDEMDEEMRSHIEMRVQEKIAMGINPKDAREAALRQFGWAESIKETCRDQRGVRWIEDLAQDIRYGARMLRKDPCFTAVAVMTLALCLGANLAIFSAVDAILVRPLPFPDADRLVILYNTYPKAGVDRDGSSIPNYYERRGKISAFSQIALFRHGTVITGEPGSAERVDVLRVSPEFFSTLGAGPAMGQAFTEEEMTYQTDGAAILTDGYWRQHFNGDPNVIGRSIRVDGFSKTIVGVLPPEFHFLSYKARLYLPLPSSPNEREASNRHSGTGSDMIARLKPGATLAEAQVQIDAHNAGLADSYPQAKMIAEAGFRTIVSSLHGDHVTSIRPTLLLMQAGVLCLLILGGVNLTNLLIIRANSRAKELAIRQSMGASRRRIVRQTLTEIVMLALIGGLFGLVIGAGGIRLLAMLGADRLPLGTRIVFDSRLALAALAGAIAVGILTATPIAWFNFRNYLANTLQSEGRGGTASHATQRLRHGFIVAQIAMAFILLAGAGLLGLSLKRVMAVSPGFRTDHILAGHISLPWKNYGEATARLALAERLIEQIGFQPGVSAAGVINNMPLSGNSQKSAITVKGYAPKPGESVRGHYSYGVAGNYFAAMGIRLGEGRLLSAADSHRGERVCVIDEDFARRYWPQGSPIGQRVFQGSSEAKEAEAFTIVGVVATVKQADLTESQAQGAIYFPYGFRTDNSFFVVARAGQPPDKLGLSMRNVLRQIDPELPIDDLRPMEVRVADSLVARRSPALLAGIFAVVALLLAAIGTYGVLSYAVAQRRREIGVRMALGALPNQIGRQFLSLGLRLLLAGTVIGIIGAWAAGRAMQGILFGVPALPLTTVAGTACVITIVSLVACVLPTLRASRVDPMEALRHD